MLFLLHLLLHLLELLVSLASCFFDLWLKVFNFDGVLPGFLKCWPQASYFISRVAERNLGIGVNLGNLKALVENFTGLAGWWQRQSKGLFFLVTNNGDARFVIFS